MRKTLFVIAMLALTAPLAHAQLAPEIGYVQPGGGQAGTTRELVLGGYDWTPDMQLFVHDSRIKLELIGPPSPVFVPDPPYWFGAKGRGPAWPLPREFKARLTIPAGVSPGLVRWQAANANGASPAGQLHVSGLPEVAEEASRKTPQELPALPVAVSGQIRTIEETDCYEFRAARAGPVTIELFSRRLGSPLHGMLRIHESAGKDAAGKLILDAADTEGRDLAVCFAAQAGVKYTLSLHDLDFAGDRSYVYRLLLTPGPQVLAAYPAAGRRGETRRVEFVGVGVATGGGRIESVARDVTFPAAADVASLDYRLETAWGAAPPFSLAVSDAPQHVETTGASSSPFPVVPGGVTGTIETRFGSDRYEVLLRKGETYGIQAASRSPTQPLDLELSIIGPDGKPLATHDDSPTSADPSLLFTPPLDGKFQIVVADRSTRGGSRAASYRLSIESPRDDFTLQTPEQLSWPLGTTGKLVVKVAREGAFKGVVSLALTGLPTGISAPAGLVIPANKTELAIDLDCPASAPAHAALCTVLADAVVAGKPARRESKILLATIMKPRCKITPEGLDDVRKVNRGSTYLAPLLIERLEGFPGEIVLEMTAKQQRHRQGLASDEMRVPPGATRVEYPIFVPEWMETTKTSRMILNGAVKVADPRGNVRTLLQRMELRLGILPEGSLMKLSHAGGEITTSAGSELRVPISLVRAQGFADEVRVELVETGERPPGLLSVTPLTLTARQNSADIVLRLSNDPRLSGEQTVRLRATAQRDRVRRVISETDVVFQVRGK